MSKRAATGGYDPSGIDLDAWTELEEQLEITEPSLNSEIVPHYQAAVVQESDDDDIVEIVS